MTYMAATVLRQILDTLGSRMLNVPSFLSTWRREGRLPSTVRSRTACVTFPFAALMFLVLGFFLEKRSTASLRSAEPKADHAWGVIATRYRSTRNFG
jgi:hypothetical protein